MKLNINKKHINMNYYRIISFAVIAIMLCACSNVKTRLSGNPSEVLDMDVYNKLQQKYKIIKNFQEGTAIVKIDKYGLIDGNGKEVLPCEYDTIYGVKKCFRIIVKDSQYGVVNVDGEIIKQCIYTDAHDARCSYIALKTNDKWGLADSLGKDVTQYKYEKLFPYDDTSFVAQYNGFWGVCDYKGNTLIPFKYDEINYKWVEKCPVTVVKLGEFYGLYNSKNELVLECEYGRMYADSSGYLAVKKNMPDNTTRCALIEEETGKIMIPFEYTDMMSYSEGLIAVENLNGKWGFLDVNGKNVIPFIYDGAGNFSEGLAAVQKISGYVYHSLWGKTPTYQAGYIDKKGTVVIPIKLPAFGGSIIDSEFHEGLAIQAVSKHPLVAEKYGYIDKRGNWAIIPLYDEARQFEKGIAEVVIDEKYGYINLKGEQIIPCSYDKYGGVYVNDSTIEMTKDGKKYYFNYHGKALSNPE